MADLKKFTVDSAFNIFNEKGELVSVCKVSLLQEHEEICCTLCEETLGELTDKNIEYQLTYHTCLSDYEF